MPVTELSQWRRVSRKTPSSPSACVTSTASSPLVGATTFSLVLDRPWGRPTSSCPWQSRLRAPPDLSFCAQSRCATEPSATVSMLTMLRVSGQTIQKQLSTARPW